MKKILFSIFYLLLIINQTFADDRKDELNKLFRELKIKNPDETFEIEQKIWKIWSTHPEKNDLTSLLAEGSNLVNQNKLYEAEAIFTKVIKLDPNWAEAWNKRATVLYMIGDFQESQKDINKVLELEKRHFGALAGQGLVNIQLQNYEKAIKSYERAQKIYPSMESPKIMIEKINKLIKMQLI